MADTTPTESGTIPDPPSGEDPSAGGRAGLANGHPTYRQGLVRTREGRLVGGVAAGLAAAWGTRLWLVRAGFIVTSAFAGLGVVLYVLGWLLMPEEGESESIAQRIVRQMNVQPTWVGFVLLMAGALVLAGIAGISGGVLVAAGLLVGGYVLYRGDFAMPAAPPVTPQDDVEAPPPAHVYQRTVRPPRPPRPRSYLGRLTVGVMFVVLGFMGALDALDISSPTSRHYAAAALLTIGAGLLVGTVVGRSRGLIFLGILLLPVLAIAAITDFRFGTRFDNVNLQPTSVGEIAPGYAIEAGDVYLDLTRVDFAGQTVTLDLDVGIGDISLVLPRTLDLEATAHARLGEVNVLGQWSSGLGAVVESAVDGRGEEGGTLIVDAAARLGSISIHRSNEPLLVYEDRFGGPYDNFLPYYWDGEGDPQDLLESLRTDGFVVEYGDEQVELAPRGAGEIGDAYLVAAGGHLFFDLSILPSDSEISTAFAGDGLVTLTVPSEASLTIVSYAPIRGVGDRPGRDGDRYVYERPGSGPFIFIEGYGPLIRVERP